MEVDADKSGTIEFDEFVELVRKVYKPYALMASNMQKSFDVFDADKNGHSPKLITRALVARGVGGCEVVYEHRPYK